LQPIMLNMARLSRRNALRAVLLGIALCGQTVASVAQEHGGRNTPHAREKGACPNISGTYVIAGEDGGAEFRIEQSGCERAVVVWKTHSYDGNTSSSHSLILDGRFRSYSRPWFGGSAKQRTSARFRNQVLVVTMQERLTGFTLFLRQLPNHDMCVSEAYRVTDSLPDEGELWGNAKNGYRPFEEPCVFRP
jgi:hypothetical protein